MTKSFFRLVAIAALIAFLGVFVYAVQIDQRALRELNSPRPIDPGSGKAIPSGEAANRLTIQHLSSREVADRLNQIVAEGLTFTAEDYAQSVAAMQKYFTPNGYAEYKNFLESSSMQNTLTTQGYRAGAFAEGQPLELNRGVFGGAYKWVFEVPVTISFLPRNAQTYRDNESAPQNRRILLRVQFARVDDANDPDAVKIELWQVLPPRRV